MLKKLIVFLLFLTVALPISAQVEERPLSLPLIGQIDPDSASMFLTTLAIGFVDGLNPYSLWGLVFLLGIVTAAGSKKKALVVGLTYLAVVGLTYGLMTVGFLNIFSRWGYQSLIRVVVGLIALGFALLNLYDYFFEKDRATVIGPKKQSRVKERFLRIMNPRHGLSALVTGTAVVALGITILEFPLTFSPPMIWTNIMARYQVELITFFFLLLLYLFVYLLDEVVVFLSIVFALEKIKLNRHKEQVLKLLGGVVIFALAAALILDLEVLNTLAGSLILFGGSIIVSLLLMFLFPRKIKTLKK